MPKSLDAVRSRAKGMGGSLKTFFSEVYAEMKKIVWPTREALTQATLTVMTMVLVLSVYMAIADLILRSIFTYLLKI